MHLDYGREHVFAESLDLDGSNEPPFTGRALTVNETRSNRTPHTDLSPRPPTNRTDPPTAEEGTDA